MQQTTFKKLNTGMAWLAFAIAATVYGLTVEPTASLWDCPEFITCGYKLEIGHPPGAPLFMLAANVCSQLASDPSQVALMVNLLSALLSAGCIFFLFLTITHLAGRLFMYGDYKSPQTDYKSPQTDYKSPQTDYKSPQTDYKSPQTETYSLQRVIAIEACGMVGALAYTFSDTFWFSAVEAEVYAFSSFLTALMFWLILKWEEKGEDRWIVLIAYITGLSVGVHLLCLLCLPAMAFVVYFRKSRRVTFMGIVKTLAAGFLLVAVILYGLIPGVVKAGGCAELLFTNVLGCPYNTGLLVYVVLLTAVLLFAYYMARKPGHANRLRQLSLACVLMMLVGYSSYGVIFIRANANTPMCENAPDNIFSLGSYLNREQYGYTPLLYGPAYNSELDYTTNDGCLVPKQEQGRAVYRPAADTTKQQYEVTHYDMKYLYKDNMFFPRMYSQRHAQAYEDWLGKSGIANPLKQKSGIANPLKRGNLPTTAENLRFFITYQVNFMYWRYFLWNFVGRQNNIQGHGEVEHGNWITGIRWIDDRLLGCDTSKLPSDLAQNKGRNVFYGLPLLLGLLGIAWQWRRGREGRQQLWVVMLLFVMTGLAIVVYLNQTPLQPRERDYAYAGSFYAFAVWIGLGAGGIVEKVKAGKGKWAAAVAAVIACCCLLVPIQMVSQTWDDHDRSGRYTCRDFGANYLESMQRKGAPIILTNGDNDTFPLWYNHEVEGVRRDTRDCNMEYLQTDWYIDQLKRPAYDSPALPISWQHEDYQEGRRECIPVRPELKAEVQAFMAQHPDEARQQLGDEPFELRNIISKWVLSDKEYMQCIPTDSVVITPQEGEDGAAAMVISLKGKRVLYKNELMVLEMLSHADWEHPIYTSVSSASDNLSFLRDHLVLEGLACRVSPTATDQHADVERLYDNIMHRFRYGGLSTKGIYVDEDVKRLADTHQMIMGLLIDSLLQQGDIERALAVCTKWQQEMPQENVPYTDAALSMARCYYLARQPKQGDDIIDSLLHRADEWLSWIATITPSRRQGSGYSRYLWLKTMQQALIVADQFGRTEICHQYIPQYEHYSK